MADIEEFKDSLEKGETVYIIDDKQRVIHNLVKCDDWNERSKNVVWTTKKRRLYETSRLVELEYLYVVPGRIATKEEYDNFFIKPTMDIKSYIGEQFKKGEKVYIIDDYEGYAMCFDPMRPDVVQVRTKGSNLRDCDPKNKYIFEAMLSGDVVSKEEFWDYSFD